MRFAQWLDENVVYEDEDVLIRDASPDEIPSHFVHRTDDQSDIEGIVQRGYDLNKFHRNARRLRTPEYLTKHSPKGAYALAADDPENVNQENDRRPFLVFTAPIQKAVVLIQKQPWANSKEALSKAFGDKTGAQLRNALIKRGYQAVLTPGSEQIILDPSLIQPVRHS